MNTKGYPVSDFALANGADFNPDILVEGRMAAPVWSRTLHHNSKANRQKQYAYMADGTQYEIEVASESVKETSFVDISIGGCANAGRHDVCVAPCIENPEASQIDLAPAANGKDMNLTIAGRVATYPKTKVDAEMSAKLDKLLDQNKLEPSGSVTSDGAEMPSNGSATVFGMCRDIMDNQECIRQENLKYNYKGVDYVRVEAARCRVGTKFNGGTESIKPGESYWFKCEPIIAKKNANGRIDIQEALVPVQFELQGRFHDYVESQHFTNVDSGKVQFDVSQFGVGKFMNRVLLKEIFQSVGLELDQNQNQNQQQDAERSL